MSLTFDDPEALCLDLAADLLEPVEPDVTVRVGVGSTWTPDQGEVLSVVWDGSITGEHPVTDYPTVRLVARAATRTRAKELLLTARALLLGSRGRGPVRSFRPLTGPFVGDDGDADVCWCTIRAVLRARPL